MNFCVLLHTIVTIVSNNKLYILRNLEEVILDTLSTGNEKYLRRRYANYSALITIQCIHVLKFLILHHICVCVFQIQ
jgi:hypothetical protein